MKQYWHQRKLGDFLCIFIGAVTTLGFAPFDFYWLPVITVASLMWLLRDISPRRAFWRGGLFGIGLFGTGTSWVYVSIHVYGEANPPLAVLITALLIGTLALVLALQPYLFNRFFKPTSTSLRLLPYLLAFPALWVLSEWLRSVIFTGFPWLFLGYTQLASPLRGYGPLVGVYGLSFLVCVSAALLLACFLTRGWRRYTSLGSLLGLWLIGALLAPIQWTTPQGPPLKATLIQGNMPQEIKWLPEQQQNTLQLYADLTAQNWDSDIILWPENALPVFKHRIENYLTTLSFEATQHNTAVLVGLPMNGQDDGQYHNSMVALGTGSGTYHKYHLVPFGEYLPLDGFLREIVNFFDLPMSGFAPGAKNQPLLRIDNSDTQLAPFICYEIAFPQQVLRSVPEADILLTTSDDSWFGNSIGPHQHFQIARMRALETGRYLLRATNTGITAIIGPKGEVLIQAPSSIPVVITEDIMRMTGRTPLVALGIIPLLILCLLIFLIVYRYESKR